MNRMLFTIASDYFIAQRFTFFNRGSGCKGRIVPISCRNRSRLNFPGGKAHSQTTDNAFYGKAIEYLAKRLTPSDYDFYLCDEREMIRDIALLVDERFSGSLVYLEVLKCQLSPICYHLISSLGAYSLYFHYGCS